MGGLLLAWIPLFPWLMNTVGPLGRAYSLLHLCLAVLSWGLRGGLAVVVINYLYLLSLALRHWRGFGIRSPAVVGLVIPLILMDLIGRLVDIKNRLLGELAERRCAEERLKEHQQGLERTIAERTDLLRRKVEEALLGVSILGPDGRYPLPQSQVHRDVRLQPG